MARVQDFESRIENITTQWSLVLDAAAGDSQRVDDARSRIIHRYARPIYGYLYAAVRDFDAADDLAQEFALRCLRGDLARVEQGQGRFRDYLKAVLRNLVNDYYRQHTSRVKLEESLRYQSLNTDENGPAERALIEALRSEILDRAWRRLRDEEVSGSNPGFYTVLRLKSEQPSLNSEQLAEQASCQLKRPVSAAAVRQLVSRSRKAFAGFLLSEIRDSIDSENADDIDRELIELDLYRYCRGF